MSHAVSVGSDHPSLPGHFPGAPIVPGVVVVSRVLSELQRQRPQLRVVGIKKLKFLHLILPEQFFTVEFADTVGQAVRFKCRRREAPHEVVIEGHLTVRDAAGEQGPRAENSAGFGK